MPCAPPSPHLGLVPSPCPFQSDFCTFAFRCYLVPLNCMSAKLVWKCEWCLLLSRQLIMNCNLLRAFFLLALFAELCIFSTLWWFLAPVSLTRPGDWGVENIYDGILLLPFVIWTLTPLGLMYFIDPQLCKFWYELLIILWSFCFYRLLAGIFKVLSNFFLSLLLKVIEFIFIYDMFSLELLYDFYPNAFLFFSGTCNWAADPFSRTSFFDGIYDVEFALYCVL